MRKRIRQTAIVLLSSVLLYALFNFRLVDYGLKQLRGQLLIIYHAKPVEYFLHDKEFPKELKDKLNMVEAVRKFAMDSLGLKNSKNYTTLYDQHDKPVLWVLTACKPFSTDPYEWKFPFLGEVSYKGFFEKGEGEKEKAHFDALLYDTDLSPAGGWSTLGFFRDPLLSGMLKRSEGRLAELIIHELTHATLFLPGSVEFNENFATFVGEQGAERFLAAHFGKNSKELRDYIYFREDASVYGKYMVNAWSRLDSLYGTFTNESFEEKLKKKYDLIIEIITGIRLLPLHNKDRYVFKFPGDELPNNTYFTSYKTYRSSQEQLMNELREMNDDLKAYIMSMKSGK